MSEVFEDLKKAILEGDEEDAIRLSDEAIKSGLDPLAVIETSVLEAVNIVGERLESGIALLTGLLMSGNAAKASVNILKDEIRKAGKQIKSSGRAVIGNCSRRYPRHRKDDSCLLAHCEWFRSLRPRHRCAAGGLR